MKNTRKKQTVIIILSSILLLALLAFSYILTTLGNQNKETVYIVVPEGDLYLTNKLIPI